MVDPDDNDVPRDGKTIGEIVARSDGVMAGYWKQPEATAQVMRNGWFHTGDMATLDENGYALIVDRKKDIIVSGGENIASLEVEKALLAHPGIYEVAVIPVPDERWGEVPKALVVMKPGVVATEAEIIKFVAAISLTINARAPWNFLIRCPGQGPARCSRKSCARSTGRERRASVLSSRQRSNIHHGGTETRRKKLDSEVVVLCHWSNFGDLGNLAFLAVLRVSVPPW